MEVQNLLATPRTEAEIHAEALKTAISTVQRIVYPAGASFPLASGEARACAKLIGLLSALWTALDEAAPGGDMEGLHVLIGKALADVMGPNYQGDFPEPKPLTVIEDLKARGFHVEVIKEDPSGSAFRAWPMLDPSATPVPEDWTDRLKAMGPGQVRTYGSRLVARVGPEAWEVSGVAMTLRAANDLLNRPHRLDP